MEAVAQTCSVKKVFLEISQNSQENTSARVSILIKWHRCFPVNFAKFLRTPFLNRTSPVAASVHKTKDIKKNVKQKIDEKF